MTTASKSKSKNKPRAKKSERKIKYLIKGKDGEFVIELPESWKVTFSTVNPNSNGGSYDRGFCIRIWEGTKLRAVFNNAERFRDLSIPLLRKVEKETGNAEWTFDSANGFEESTRKIEKESSFAKDDTVDGLVFDDEDL